MRKHRLLSDVGERLRSIHIDSRRRATEVEARR
jgi:hypothetical protein